MRSIFFLIFPFYVFCDGALSGLLYQLRSPETKAKEFRESLEKIGEYLALEVDPYLVKKDVVVKTLTGVEAKHRIAAEKPVLVTILRAGLPLCSGVQKVFPHSEVGFLGMARNEETLKSIASYIALPNLEGKCVVVIDTMIATAGSMLDALEIIRQRHPSKIVILAAISSSFGVAKLKQACPDVELIVGVVDPDLNEKGYIVPGLGDAGDRSYGLKSHK